MRLSFGLFAFALIIGCIGGPIKSDSRSEVEDWTSHIAGNKVLGKEIGSACLNGSNDSLIELSFNTKGPKNLRAEWKVNDGILMEFYLRCYFDSLVEDGYLDLEEHFSSLYGPHNPTAGYSSWKTSSSDGKLVEVELINGQILYGRNEVIAHWNVHEDRLYED